MITTTAHTNESGAPACRESFGPLRSLGDVVQLERRPIEAQLGPADFGALLRNAAEEHPHKPALHYMEHADPACTARTWSYIDLHASGRRVAGLLAQLGVGPTDPVALVMPTVPELYMSLFGAFWTGIAFPVNWMLRPSHLLHLIGTARAKIVVALGPTPGFGIWEGLQSIASQLGGATVLSVTGPGGTCLPGSDLLTRASACNGRGMPGRAAAPGDVAAFIHSGGTTGLPKLVRITHRGLAYRVWATSYTQAMTADEVVFADNPFSHIGGLMRGFGQPMAQGATAVIPGPLGARDKDYLRNYWRLVEKYRVTRLSGVPTTLSALVNAPPRDEDVSTLKPHFATGSTAIPEPVHRGIREVTGVRPLIMYGMTENTGNLTLDPRDGATRYGSSGIRLPYTHIRAVRLHDDGSVERDCGPGESGTIIYQSPGMTPGYVDPRFDRGAFTPDGWFISGDLGKIDEEGYVWITGRTKDLIIRGGHNIDPAMIEEALQQSPDVLLASAVGRPDAHSGEVPVAYVQLVPGSRATPEDLAAFAAARVAERPAAPKEVYVVDAIPLTDVGKPFKAQMRLDAARRATVKALEGILPPGAVQVEVASTEGGGLSATVTLIPTAGYEHEAMQAAADAALRKFTIPFSIRFEAPDDPAILPLSGTGP